MIYATDGRGSQRWMSGLAAARCPNIALVFTVSVSVVIAVAGRDVSRNCRSCGEPRIFRCHAD